MSTNDFAAFAALDLTPIKMKLMHVQSGEGWSALRADAVEAEYRRFLFLMKKYPDAEASPTVDVDTFWHYHILDTQKYAVDCEALFGYFLHHYPYVGIGAGMNDDDHAAGGERMRMIYEAEFGAWRAANDDAFCSSPGKPVDAVAFCSSPGKPAEANAAIAFCSSPGKPHHVAAFCSSPGKRLDTANAAAAFCSSPGKPVPAAIAFCSSPGEPVRAATAFCSSPGKPVPAATAFCSSPGKPVPAATAFCSSPGKPVPATTAFCSSPGKPVPAATAFCSSPGKPVPAATAFCSSPGKPSRTRSAGNEYPAVAREELALAA